MDRAAYRLRLKPSLLNRIICGTLKKYGVIHKELTTSQTHFLVTRLYINMYVPNYRDILTFANYVG